MYLLFLSLFLYNVMANDNKTAEEPSVYEVAKILVSLLDENETSNERLNELKEKMKTINAYVVDKDKYAQVLMNESIGDCLNETNFYKSLIEEDQFKLVADEEPKSLYLQMKDKMNRDDIFQILLNRNKTNHVVRSARRMMNDDISARISKVEKNEVIDEVVDKYLGEPSSDHHNYSNSDLKTNNMFWDPHKDLEELQTLHSAGSGRRIYHGLRTSIQDYPFMVTIHIMGRFWCGGSLYNWDLVITSAACLQLMHNNRFFRENPRVLQVRVGSNHSRISGEVLDALEVYFHPAYNPRTLRNNIAVIRLRRRLSFSDHRVPKAIEISHTETPPAPTSEVIVLGWGVTKMSQRLTFEPIYLQRKMIPVYPNHFCKEVYGEKFITTTMFCAGTMTTGEGACDHDAGGPAVLAGFLVGVISFGPSVCGYPNAPTVFTLVGSFSNWIDSVNDTKPEYYSGSAKITSARPYDPTQVILLAEEMAQATPSSVFSLDMGAGNEPEELGMRAGSDSKKKLRSKQDSKEKLGRKVDLKENLLAGSDFKAHMRADLRTKEDTKEETAEDQ